MYVGILTKFSRNFNHVIVWNDGFAPPPYATQPTPASSSSSSSSRGSAKPPLGNDIDNTSAGDSQQSASTLNSVLAANSPQESLSTAKVNVGPTNGGPSGDYMRKLARDYHSWVYDIAAVLEVLLLKRYHKS